ncbi:DUF1761 family protein [Candidatus Woesearchaeota archaeon]|nr:DUF1761 family protein [Candidatus Woesearchaeota archaeon]
MDTVFIVVPAAVAALVSFIFGFLWYGPLFGKSWMKYAGVKKRRAKNMALRGVAGYFSSFAIALLLWFATSTLSSFGSPSVSEIMTVGSFIGVLVWAGFFVPLNLGPVLWQNKSGWLFAINAAHWLIAIQVMMIVASLMSLAF